jgi:hypothetical protein
MSSNARQETSGTVIRIHEALAEREGNKRTNRTNRHQTRFAIKEVTGESNSDRTLYWEGGRYVGSI